MLFINYIILAVSAAIFFVAIKLLNKITNNNKWVYQGLSILLGLIAYFDYQIKNPAISNTYGLNIYSPFGDNVIQTIIGMLLLWFTYATVLLLILYPYFKHIKNIKNVIKFFGVPVLVLDIVFFKILGIAIAGSNGFEGFNSMTILLAVEVGLCIGIVINEFISKDYFKISKKEIKYILITILPLLLAIMPGFTLQCFFADPNNINIKFSGLTQEHRLMLYGAVIVPTIIFHLLRKTSDDIKRFSMIYLSLATLWTFMFHFELIDWLDPTCWPFHLCNTAMFIIPLCLIFNLKKLFYFTFFINVFGAAMAMCMPNVGEGLSVLSSDTIIFFTDHYCAFFMPVLIVALGIFERPKFKQWKYSMIAFGVYFLAMLILNAWFTNYDPDVDFFFLNSDFIAKKLGTWAKNLRGPTLKFNIGNLIFIFYPLYQFLFFLTYTGLSLAMWFIYEQLFRLWDNNNDRRAKEKDYKKMKKDLEILIEGRKEVNQMSKDVKACLELKEFSKKYGVNNYYSVENASLKINGGEIFGFLGPNGAGKSTIIKSIVGIQTITKGSIEICGYDVEKESVDAKKEIGFVPDHYALYENLTGREYINYIADLYGVSQKDRDERIEKYVKNFQLETAFDNQMKTYSHGMKQKMTIMAALVHNPKVWILDEPLTGLDPNSIYQVKECMKEHASEGNIVFFSSHIIDVVERICDRIAIIKKGHIQCCVSLKELEEKKINLEDFYLKTIGNDTEGK